MKTKTIKLKLLLASISLCMMFGLKAQTPNSVGIGTANPNNSAILHLESSNQGFLMTRLNSSQINAITAPTVGLIVYNTTDQCYWYKRPTYWARLCNTDSINAQNVITNTFTADTTFINVNNFGNGYGDSIWVHYAQIDTAIINTLTVHTINADSIFLGGNSITTVITDSIKSLAWLLRGNTGTNPAVNFLGTIDNQDLVFRTNNIEKVRVTAPGNVGIGTSLPHSSALLELKGTDKGFLTTRLNTTQINAIVSPTIGLLTYNTDDNCYWYKHTFGWKRICNTDSLGNVFINTLTTNTINAQTINTSTIVAGTGTFTTITTNSLTTNIYNFGSGIGDSIWVHYAEIDTAFIHQLTVNTIKADSIYLGGNSITTVISDSITNMSWLLKGNLNTNPAINFLGTRDNQPLVIRTNNTEKLRVTSTGSVGIGINAPTAKLDVIGNTKTTNFQMTSGATNGFILRSDAVGSGSWTPAASVVSVLTPTVFNTNAWTLLGNTGTNPTINFAGTTDNVDYVIRTNNLKRFTYTTSNELLAAASPTGATGPFSLLYMSPQYGFEGSSGDGLFSYNDTLLGISKNKQPIFWFDKSNNIINSPFSISQPVVSSNSTFNQVSKLNAGTMTLNGSSFNYVMPAASAANLTSATYCHVFGGSSTISNSNNIKVLSDFSQITGSTFSGIYGVSNVMTNGNRTYIFGDNVTTSKASNIAIGCGSSFDYSTWGATNFITFSAPGGTRMYSNGIGTTGVALASGGGAWASISDRNLKENIKEISSKNILEKLLKVPVTEWTYISQKVDSMNKYAPEGIHYDKAPVHIGPMAQDFAEVFSYGEFKDKITTSDIDGVMFIAIQALAIENKEIKEILKAKEAEIKKLTEEQNLKLLELEKLIHEIKQR